MYLPMLRFATERTQPQMVLAGNAHVDCPDGQVLSVQGGADLVGVEDVVIGDVAEVARAGGDYILEHASLVCGLLNPYVKGEGSLAAPLHPLNRHARPCIHSLWQLSSRYT